MIVRPVDEKGDMMPVAYSSQMLDKSKAVAQVVKQRLRLYFGEWWEDESAGFRVPDFLADGIRHENVGMLMKYITSYVAETEGVGSISNANVTIEGHRMTYDCVVHVGEEAERIEVELDGLL